MLQGRLTVLAVVALAACGGSDDTTATSPEPAIDVSALDEPGEIACAAAAANLRAAVQSYELEFDAAPTDEAALVDGGYLRAENDLWDVDDGSLVPVDPACENVPGDVDAVDILTDEDAPLTADEFYRGLTPEAIEAFGGEDCAQEVAEIYAAGERFVADRGEAPDDIAELVDSGYLEQPERWRLDGDDLVPIEGSGCSTG